MCNGTTTVSLLAEGGCASVISVRGAARRAPKFTLPTQPLPPRFHLPFPPPSHLCVAVINSELLQRILLMSRSQRPNRPQPPQCYQVSGQPDPASKNTLPDYSIQSSQRHDSCPRHYWGLHWNSPAGQEMDS